jgi:hypothetical protein
MIPFPDRRPDRQSGKRLTADRWRRSSRLPWSVLLPVRWIAAIDRRKDRPKPRLGRYRGSADTGCNAGIASMLGGWDVVVRGPSRDGMQPRNRREGRAAQHRQTGRWSQPLGCHLRSVRLLRRTCHFTSARKLGVGSALMTACLDAFAVTLGVPPAAAPWIAGDWRVTCAAY